MSGMLAIGILFVAVAVALAARAATMRRAHAVRTVARVAAYGYPTDVPPADALPLRSRLGRILDGTAGRLGLGLRRWLLGASEDDVRALLRGAGRYRTTPTTYAFMRLVAVAVTVMLAVWFVAARGLTPLTGFVAVFLVAAGWLLPPTELKRQRDRRLARIDRGLADLVDFLVVTIEAGVGFGSALNAAATRFQPPLGDELRLTVQEQSMGLSTEEALRNFLARCDTPMTRSFVRSVLQAESLGVSIGQILRGLALEMRKRRRQAAEEQAHKAPVKIVFPLAFLILPAMFLIVLGPALSNLFHALKG